MLIGRTLCSGSSELFIVHSEFSGHGHVLALLEEEVSFGHPLACLFNLLTSATVTDCFVVQMLEVALWSGLTR